MAAGLIPVVPNDSGPAEFIPQEYQYNSIEQAAEIITRILNNFSEAEQMRTSNHIIKFSNSHYITGFKTILNELLIRRRFDNASQVSDR